jgi:hypothetical protein
MFGDDPVARVTLSREMIGHALDLDADALDGTH